MPTPFEVLSRILDHEANGGFLDQSVTGGMIRFAEHWEQEIARAIPPGSTIWQADEIVNKLKAYGSLATAEARAATVSEVRALASVLESVLAAATGPVEAHVPPPQRQAPVSPSEVPAEPAAADTPPAATAVAAAPPTQEVSTAPARAVPVRGQGIDSSVTVLVGINEGYAKRLARLGIETVRDLLYLYPRRYRDYSDIRPVSSLKPGEEVSVIGEVWETVSRRARSGLVITTSLISDGSGMLEATFFNQPYLEAQLQQGRRVVLSGKIEVSSGRFSLQSPEWELMNGEPLHTARMVPMYPLTEGVGAKWMRRLQKRVVDYWAKRVPDSVPPAVLEEYDLPDLATALSEIHFPTDAATLERARRRLCFDEFLLIQVGVLRQRRAWRGLPGRALDVSPGFSDEFLSSLPFALTGAQLRALSDILGDISKTVPMSRMLQGDVGSGKTVVALAGMMVAFANGAQSALMAPTEILAEQHHRTISGMVERWAANGQGRKVPVVRLVKGNQPRTERAQAREEIAAGMADIVVGTHALIQQDVQFKELAFAVIDEQHRFGVMQRSLLRDKGYNPHVLVMSATPIPRSLSLTLYGDLDLTIIDELPPGRQVVKTYWLTSRERERAYKFVRGQVAKGRQAFVICPLIEESDTMEIKSAVEEHRRLSEDVFPDLRIGLLHGKMRSDDKDEAMTRFRAGEYHILVSTSVVEVGIDVPNATVMMVEGADRFGLAQLHQFRGRVGRGEHESFCLLISDTPSLEGVERLGAIETIHDGFALAEKDLELRGPGEFFGTRQSGLPDLRLAKLSDTRILESARKAAIRIVEADPDLALPEHRLLGEQVREFWRGKGDLS